MKTYVTFGQSHKHEIEGTVFDKDCVGVITHEKDGEGSPLSFKIFGSKFCCTWPEKYFDPEMMKYFPRGLVNVPRS